MSYIDSQPSVQRRCCGKVSSFSGIFAGFPPLELHWNRYINLICAVYSVQCTVYSVPCTVYSLQFTVYSVQGKQILGGGGVGESCKYAAEWTNFSTATTLYRWLATYIIHLSMVVTHVKSRTSYTHKVRWGEWKEYMCGHYHHMYYMWTTALSPSNHSVKYIFTPDWN